MSQSNNSYREEGSNCCILAVVEKREFFNRVDDCFAKFQHGTPKKKYHHDGKNKFSCDENYRPAERMSHRKIDLR